jgi:uncharacterized membrane protein YhaH (DUF805 family)
VRLFELFLSPHGRISRLTFWTSFLILDFSFCFLFVFTEELFKTRLSHFWFLIIAWPLVAISIKRWHDRNKTGWWLIITLIPVLGIWNLVECGFLSGTPGPNKFGPNPKEKANPTGA